MKRENFFPTNYTMKIEKDNGLVFLYSTDNSEFVAMGFSGRRSKPDFNYRFSTKEKRDAYVADFFASLREKIEYKKSLKKQKEDKFKTVKVGDIFHSSWGYDQTQADFYQLVELKGKTGVFREISSSPVEGTEYADSCRVQPNPNDFIGEPFKKRLNGDSITMTSYSSARKCDPKKNYYCSWGR